MHGGVRQGAGRKQGFAAKDAEEARRYFSQRVAEEVAPLADMLIRKAKEGDIRALQVLLDRAWGRPRQEVQIITPEVTQEVSPRVRHIAELLNGVARDNLSSLP